MSVICPKCGELAQEFARGDSNPCEEFQHFTLFKHIVAPIILFDGQTVKAFEIHAVLNPIVGEAPPYPFAGEK